MRLLATSIVKTLFTHNVQEDDYPWQPNGERVASLQRRAPGLAPRNVTLMDVARAAGVGKSTVSNVLNGSGRVGDAARARVLETVDQLGYRPHHGARSLRSRRTMQLAYFMPLIQLEPTNLIMMQFMQSLLRVGAQRHYRVLAVAQETDPLSDIRALAAGRIVDGVVLSELQPDDRRTELLAELGMPFACFGRVRPGLPQSWADIDNVTAEAEAVRHVTGRGYTQPAYIGYASRTYWDVDREAGFRAGLAHCGIPGDGAGLLRVDHDAGARAAIMSFLSSARPDVVLTGSDIIAVIVYGAAAELDLRIGRDIAVVGFDGSVSTALLHPHLTSVVIPVDDIARRIVSRALWQVENGPDDAPGETVPTWLREGGSTPARG
jgi:DNA-binding LacI/PurR family transcriptional regulator